MVFKAYQEIESAIKLARPFEQVIINKATVYNASSLASIRQNAIMTSELQAYFTKSLK
jgi:hypothetical protein